MLKRFKPDEMCESVFDIDLKKLLEKGITHLIIDIDNTIVPWGKMDISKNTLKWIDMAKAMGFNMCLVSNNNKSRVEGIGKYFNLPYISSAKKPLKSGFIKAGWILHKNQQKSKTAVIGDQFFTDVLGAKRLGFYAILVRPLNKNELFVTKINRIFEKMILKYYMKDGSR